MVKVNMHEAKTQLSRLGRLAWRGEEVVIARSGDPYLRLQPYQPRAEGRRLGGLEGEFWMSPNFDEPDKELADLLEQSKVMPDEGA